MTSLIRNGSIIKIIYSHKLMDYKLINLVGQSAVITECKLKGTTNPGAWVIITKGINKGEEWFIPLRSIQTRETVNRLRSRNILKELANLSYGHNRRSTEGDNAQHREEPEGK